MGTNEWDYSLSSSMGYYYIYGDEMIDLTEEDLVSKIEDMQQTIYEW